nr:MAG TPA: hypothetical protein [Caudoviricetes sp.]
MLIVIYLLDISIGITKTVVRLQIELTCIRTITQVTAFYSRRATYNLIMADILNDTRYQHRNNQDRS